MAEETITEKERNYLRAVGNRCSISDHGNKCVNCKAVKESVKYVKYLRSEVEGLEKRIVVIRTNRNNIYI